MSKARLTYTNRTSAGEWTVTADTSRELFAAIESKLGSPLEPRHKRAISRALRAGVQS